MSSLYKKLKSALLFIRGRFSQREDSEHEQAFVRLIIGGMLGIYSFWEGDSIQRNWFIVGAVTVALLITIHIAIFPRISKFRRLFAATVDVATLTFFFFRAEEYSAPIYALYLWIIFGHGVRYGRLNLFYTLALSLVGLGAAVLTQPYWANQQTFGIGLWVGMLLVSLYVSKLVGRLMKALQYAEAANQAKRQFISSVSHELRTPLNAIIGMHDLLRSTTLNAEQKEMLGSLGNASHLMLSLIEDVLDFSKIEAGKLVIEQVAFDLCQLINSLTDIFKYQAETRGLTLVSDISSDIPYLVCGDAHYLRQVLVNLLSNAMKFTEQGSVTLRVAVKEATTDTVLLRFEVEDTGIGIARDAQDKIFNSFTQANDSITRCYGGTGLGTTISKQLVELMGGKLGLRSELGVGSTFWFELKCLKHTAASEAQAAEIRVLLVGFAQGDLPQVGAMLETWSLSYKQADNLDAAIAKLEESADSGKPYKFVLLHESCVTTLIGLAQDLRRAAQTELSVILCGTDCLALNNKAVLVEHVGLSAALELPLDKRLLFDAIHSINLPATNADVVSLSQYYQDREQRPQYHILVADDNPTNRMVLQKILERAGHLCTLVENGEEALDQLEEQNFDAVVLDMNMPEMNGLDAAKAYRFMAPNDVRAPIIIFSADVTVEAKEKCLNAGVDAFLPKPIEVALFTQTLEQLIAQSPRAQQKDKEKDKEKDKVRLERSERKPTRTPSKMPILAQPVNQQTVLNYATLAELGNIAQDSGFVEALIDGFVQDGQILLERVQESLLVFQYDEFRDAIHAMKGSALSIGAISLKEMCQALEKMPREELQRDVQEVLWRIKHDFDQVCEALVEYRQQCHQAALH